MKICSFTEYGMLKEVIVGSGFGMTDQAIDFSFKVFYKEFYDWGWLVGSDTKIQINSRYVRELEEDIQGFVKVLKSAGVVIHRPKRMTSVSKIATPDWTSETIPALNVRDQAIVLGNAIVETPCMLRNRYFENFLLKDIFQEAFMDGARWLNMPRSSLTSNSLQNFSEMLMDGAQLVRFGDHVLVNCTNPSHDLAFLWFQREFPDIQFHKIHSCVSNHLDSYIVPVAEGTLLLRDKSFLEQMPSFLKDWNILYSPRPTENQFPVYSKEDTILTTPFIDMNCLALGNNRVIVNSLFPELCELLSDNGLEVLEVPHRHRRIFAGGWHCFTLDLLREESA